MVSVALVSLESAWAESHFDEKIEFQHFERTPKLTVSPDGRQLALISVWQCWLFKQSGNGERWLGPYETENGGYLGRQEKYVEDRSVRRKLPFFGWTEQPDDSFAFVISTISGESVRFEGDRLVESSAPYTISQEFLDRPTGRRRYSGMDTDYKIVEPLVRNHYKKRLDAATRTTGFTSSKIDWERIENPHGIGDFSPDGIRVLVRLRQEDKLGCLNMATGEVVPLIIGNERPRTLPGHASGSFSPDGQYILMSYNYGHADHYGGGYLQLYTRDGEFIEEAAAVPENAPSGSLYHEWLANNWIVYWDGKKVTFRQFVGPAPAKQETP